MTLTKRCAAEIDDKACPVPAQEARAAKRGRGPAAGAAAAEAAPAVVPSSLPESVCEGTGRAVRAWTHRMADESRAMVEYRRPVLFTAVQALVEAKQHLGLTRQLRRLGAAYARAQRSVEFVAHVKDSMDLPSVPAGLKILWLPAKRKANAFNDFRRGQCSKLRNGRNPQLAG